MFYGTKRKIKICYVEILSLTWLEDSFSLEEVSL